MELVFIYGPPGVGKLTVSKSLARLTGYRVFHNHLTIDLIRNIFETKGMEFSTLSSKLRFDIIRSAAKENINGMIFTMVYSNPSDNRFVAKVIKLVERHKGKVMFVKLKCKNDILYKRITYTDRKLFKKLRDPAALGTLLKKYDLDTPVPYKKSLVIDNTKIKPAKVAKMIKTHYKL